MQLADKITTADLNGARGETRAQPSGFSLSCKAVLRLVSRGFGVVLAVASIAAISAVGALSTGGYLLAKALGRIRALREGYRFLSRAYDRFIELAGGECVRDTRDTPALRLMVSLTLTAVPIFAMQLVLGKPRLLLAIAFYLSLCGLKFQRSVRMFSTKHMEAHRPQGYFSDKYDKVFGRYAEFFLGYFYGDLPELGRTVHVRLHHKENGGFDDNASTLRYDRTRLLDFFRYLSDNIWTTLGIGPYAYFKARGDEKNRKRMLWGMTRYCIYFSSGLYLRLENRDRLRFGSASLHEFHHGDHFLGAARLL